MEDIHSEKYVKSLFDEMSETYGIMNILSSLGSSSFWRRQAVYSLPEDSVVVGDFMAGGAECLFYMKKRFGHSFEIHLVDWSEKMCKKASSTIKRRKASGCEVMNASAWKITAFELLEKKRVDPMPGSNKMDKNSRRLP